MNSDYIRALNAIIEIFENPDQLMRSREFCTKLRLRSNRNDVRASYSYVMKKIYTISGVKLTKLAGWNRSLSLAVKYAITCPINHLKVCCSRLNFILTHYYFVIMCIAIQTLPQHDILEFKWCNLR